MERDLGALRARLEAAASQVAIELGPAGAGRVKVGGGVLSRNIVRPAIDQVMIVVDDLATITISPPAGTLAADQKKRQQLQTRLSELLGNMGAASAAELRGAHARRQELEAETKGFHAELAALGLREQSPATAMERIKTEIEQIDAHLAETLADLKLDALPEPEDIDRQQTALRQSREDGRRKRQTLDGTIEAQNAILAGIADKRGQVRGSLAEIQARLDGDLAILPDVDRKRLIDEAQEEHRLTRDDHRTKAAALEEQRQKAPSPDELERRVIRISRLDTAIENQRSQIGTLDREIANLEGQIQNAGGDGLGEKVETLQEQRDLAYREVERHKARVATLQLLKDTIEACYKEQRDRLHAPLRRHLQPFLNDVFPSAELELGDGFTVSGIKRNGPAAENFDRLSAGTQEQIAVIVRLAMGAMICERGQEVPIILDDALVFSDDERIEQMFDALNRAGQKQQVIVLTCRTRTFAALGGRQLSITSGAPLRLTGDQN